jgi:hypothetical protein
VVLKLSDETFLEVEERMQRAALYPGTRLRHSFNARSTISPALPR